MYPRHRRRGTHWKRSLGLTRLRRRRPRPAIRIGALALAAGSLTAVLTGVAVAYAVQVQSPAGGASTSDVKKLPLSYLREQAKYHFAGYSLPGHTATSVPTSEIPLLPTAAAGATAASSPVYGLDVSSFQGNVNWSAQKAAGALFAYVKATEGSYYTNPYFAQQYNGSYNVGLIRGAYHFANPSYSSGATQATYFLNHGGGWSKDGKTLPGALDIEANPYGSQCYNLSQAAMRSWINSFVTTYHTRTTRWPVVYTNYLWWVTCTGNWNGLATNDPLWIAKYSSSPGPLPAGYSFYTFWQFASSGKFAGDQDVFNGNASRLSVLATG
ncbi:MAG: lysozyme [Actinobacteria bacterium]|nr:lysozyme [Actinomycetota bacterium]MBO0835965.1 lysozyme [Actinomycetota bacterium]